MILQQVGELNLKFKCYRWISDIIKGKYSEVDYHAMKKYATIAVDIILEYLAEDGYPPEVKNWEEVKQEIENYEK